MMPGVAGVPPGTVRRTVRRSRRRRPGTVALLTAALRQAAPGSRWQPRSRGRSARPGRYARSDRSHRLQPRHSGKFPIMIALHSSS
eukprot:755010-Hanusia_phi.AAC.1